MSKLLELAELCEKAEGPDRELDELIAAELAGAVREWQPALGRAAYYHKSGSPWMHVHVPDPGYTASLDAARSLIPDEWLLVTLSEIAGDGMAYCELGNPFHSLSAKGICEDLARTICAAALKARATQEQPE